ncbi:MAG: DUF4347 domain-containing protein [Pirellulaceae bacterium]
MKRFLNREKPRAADTGESRRIYRPLMEALEPRTLYDGSPLGFVAESIEAAFHADSGDDLTLDPAIHSMPDAFSSIVAEELFPDAVAPNQITEIVFVDGGIDDAAVLIDSLNQQNGHSIAVFRIDSDSDGVEQISQVLDSYTGIEAIHIVSHGDTGVVQLGNGALGQHNLQAYAGQIAQWQSAMSSDADIFIYGCQVAATESGQDFIEQLAALTSADVAASDDLTGAEILGGDWDLEYVAGAIDSSLVLHVDNWNSILDLTAAGGEKLVNTSTPENQVTTPYGGGNVGMDSSGRYVVVWEDYRSGNADSYAKVYNADGSVRVNEFRVHAANTSAQDWTNVSMADNGNFVVTWSDNRSGNYEVYMRLFSIDGTALSGETLVSTLSGTQDAHASDFASDGSFVVTFQNATDTDIYFQRYNASGVAQGVNTKANTYTTSTQNHPDVAVNNDGSFVISWMSNGQDGDLYGMYAQRFTAAGAKVGGEIQISSTWSGNQYYGTIDNDDSGNFVATWMSSDGNGYGIWARRFNSSGTALAGEFQVNLDSG